MPAPPRYVQETFDALLGDPLAMSLQQTTFVVVDLETTGGTPDDCGITEIGAVKACGGEELGEFGTLVNPGQPIPPFVTVLTGITEAMIAPAPRLEEALPAFLEFARGAVLVIRRRAACHKESRAQRDSEPNHRGIHERPTSRSPTASACTYPGL